MSFGGKNMKREREKGENVVEKGRKGKVKGRKGKGKGRKGKGKGRKGKGKGRKGKGKGRKGKEKEKIGSNKVKEMKKRGGGINIIFGPKYVDPAYMCNIVTNEFTCTRGKSCGALL
jgi:hypothetical protein